MATDTTITTQAPWEPQQSYLKQGFSEAQRLYGSGGPQYYGSSTVAPFSDTTNRALNSIEGQAYDNPQLQRAQGYFNDTMSGKYLNSNPYLDQMYNRAASAVTRNFRESVMPGVSARFGMSGRSGSGLMQNAIGSAYDSLGRNLEGMASNMYGQNYANERQNMQNVYGSAPELMQAQAGLYNNALQAGQARDTQSQAQLTDDVNRYQFDQMRPFENLNRYLGSVGGGFGSQGSQQTPAYNTPWWQYALGGLGLAGSLF